MTFLHFSLAWSGREIPACFFAKRGRAGKVGQRKFPRTLNLEGRAAAVPRTTLTEIPSYVLPGTVHPKPAKTRATLQEIPLYEVPGAVHRKPAEPRSCGAAHNPKRNILVRGPGGRAT